MATRCMETSGGTRSAAGTRRRSGGACGLESFLRSGRGILEAAAGHLIVMGSDGFSGMVEVDGVKYDVTIAARRGK